MFANLFEKPPRLGRKAVALAGSGMKSVERRHGLGRVLKGHLDAIAVCPADVAAGAVPECFLDLVLAAAEFYDVGAMLRTMRGPVEQRAAALDLDVLPTGAVTVLSQPLHQNLENFRRVGDRVADVRERQGHAALAGKEAVDFHYRDKTRDFAILDDGEVKRLVAVGLAQHPRPSRGVEKCCPVSSEEQIVPFGVFDRVEDGDIQEGLYNKVQGAGFKGSR
jgi:hypothetical protein